MDPLGRADLPDHRENTRVPEAPGGLLGSAEGHDRLLDDLDALHDLAD